MLVLCFCAWIFPVATWAVPLIVPNYRMTRSARAIFDQIDNANKVRFDTDSGWAKFVRDHGEDHLTSGIEKINRDTLLDERTQDRIRRHFQKYLGAPAEELSVTDAIEIYLLKHLINAYDLTLA